MSIIKVIRYFLILSILFIVSCLVVLQFSLFSEDLGPGEITGSVNTPEFIADKKNRQLAAFNSLNESPTKQILFGDLHVHSCLLYTSPSPRDVEESRMPSSA